MANESTRTDGKAGTGREQGARGAGRSSAGYPEFDLRSGKTIAVERIGHLVLQYEIEGVHYTRTMTEDLPNERIIIMFDERPIEAIIGEV